MFEIGEDFIVDEGFLEDVFKAEATLASKAPEKKERVLEKASEKENLSSREVKTFCKAVRERKFPGPAGLLPERQGHKSFIATDDLVQDCEEDLKESQFKVGEILSQSTNTLFQRGTWSVFLQSMGVEGKNIIETINIESVKSRAKHSRCIKVPFLAAHVHQHLDTNSPDPSLVLKDSTGEMFGTLHRDFWEKYGDELVLGSVMVLRNVGLIATGTTARRHYVNVTENNVASIYTTNNSHEVKVINIKPVLRGDIHKILEEWRRPPKLPVQQPCDSRVLSPPLFNRIPARPAPKRLPAQHQAHKRPRLDPRMQPSSYQPRPTKPPQNLARPPQPVASSSKLDESIVESLLDGIDTDSLFGEF